MICPTVPKLWKKNGHRGQKLLTNFKDWSSEAYDNTREKIFKDEEQVTGLQHRTEMKLKKPQFFSLLI